jgi:hypothetical protein
MKMNRGRFGAWNLKEISWDLLGFVTFLNYYSGVKFEIWWIGAPCS